MRSIFFAIRCIFSSPLWWLGGALLLFLFSCKKDIPPQRPQANVGGARELIICDEGNFGSSNAGISLYDPVSAAAVNDAYAPKNSNQHIGDVLQSGTFFNGKFFWAVNNSGKVVVTDNNFFKISTITGFISPRYIQFVSNNKAYVTNFINPTNANQTNYVQVLDPNTNTIVRSIRIDGWTEQLAMSYAKVFVCSEKKKYVYVIDAFTDIVTDSIFVNATNGNIVKDENEKIWVSCNADAVNNIPARLVKINPASDSVEADISLNTTQNSISRLCINGSGTTLYYLMNDVYKMPAATGAPALFVQQGSRTFYGLCVDPADETVYVSDAIDYNQDGTISRYKVDGTFVASFKAGIIPGFMWMQE